MMKNMKSRSCPFRLAVPMGDPAGLGPEVVLVAVFRIRSRPMSANVFIADARLLVHTPSNAVFRCVSTDRSGPGRTKDTLLDGAKRINLTSLRRSGSVLIREADASAALPPYRSVEKATELAMSSFLPTRS
jgi:4-hydroxy-L-threonine phosphate dehydrogenase PdxA